MKYDRWDFLEKYWDKCSNKLIWASESINSMILCNYFSCPKEECSPDCPYYEGTDCRRLIEKYHW